MALEFRRVLDFEHPPTPLPPLWPELLTGARALTDDNLLKRRQQLVQTIQNDFDQHRKVYHDARDEDKALVASWPGWRGSTGYLAVAVIDAVRAERLAAKYEF